MMRKKQQDRLIAVVTGLTILGLIALGSMAVYVFIRRQATVQAPQSESLTQAPQEEVIAYNINTPANEQEEYIKILQDEVEIPREIGKIHSHKMRPCAQLRYLRNRAQKVDEKIALLHKLKSQESELAQLEERVELLEELDDQDSE